MAGRLSTKLFRTGISLRRSLSPRILQGPSISLTKPTCNLQPFSPWKLDGRTLHTTCILNCNVKEPSTELGHESPSSKLGGFDAAAKLYLSFTCTVCSGSNSYTISKLAYTKGVVIVTCNTCTNNHLIADNLDWFEDVKGRNIEEIMEHKGEKVQRFYSSEVKEIIPT